MLIPEANWTTGKPGNFPVGLCKIFSVGPKDVKGQNGSLHYTQFLGPFLVFFSVEIVGPVHTMRET